MDFVKTGSVRELWRVSYPMMVSFFSMMLMLFIDRLFLSFYSTEALNASAQAGTLAWGFILAWMTLASMSEVFVAQYNGAKHLSRIGSAVWQMLYLVLISFLFFFPLAYFVTPLFYERGGYAFNFFSLLMYFGPLFTLVPALAGFFIGRGDTRIIQWMAILANIVNCILDPILIFTFDLGVKGAAIATGLGTLVEALFLLYLFLKPSHRTMFGTLSLAFNPSLFLQTIKIGLPPALFVSMELLGWAAFYHLMATISPTHIFVSTVCQTVLLTLITRRQWAYECVLFIGMVGPLQAIIAPAFPYEHGYFIFNFYLGHAAPFLSSVCLPSVLGTGQGYMHGGNVWSRWLL